MSQIERDSRACRSPIQSGPPQVTALETNHLQRDGTLPPAVWTEQDRTISAATRQRLVEAVPENTARSYRTQSTAFTAWCSQAGRTALPATGETMTEYAAHLIDAQRAPGSIEVALSAIRTMHRMAGHELPDTRAARVLVRAYRRGRAAAGQRDRQAAPAVAPVIRVMIDTTDLETTKGLRDRVLLLLGFYLMARRSELAAVDLGDVVKVPEGLRVFIAKSKTDQAAEGRWVAVPYSSRPDSCPVRVVDRWREHLAGLGVTDGRLLRAVDRHGNVGGPLTGKAVNRIVHRLAETAGVPSAETMSAHSLRAGGATSAAESGSKRASIEAQGGWKPGSRVLDTYIRQRDMWSDHALAKVII